MKELELSDTERAAKDFVINLLLNGLRKSEPCDKTFCEEDFKLPAWYDESAFKRGQKYFFDNRSGIMMSNVYGLFSLICEPGGAKLLDRTQQSSTPETAKKRYISTSLNMLSWYEEELKPGSKSWESLKRVRRMHLLASRAAEKHGTGMISQAAMAMTNFGFMGYALVRPHLLGIKHDNDDDRKAFVHFWAVIGSMLGVKDEYNMCLHSLEVVGTICRIFIRYAFIPFLQLETPTFQKLGRAFIEGLKFFVPLSTYESRLFLARRLAGVPGYQFEVDMSKEFYHRQIFNQDELKRFVEEFQKTAGHEYRRHMVFDEKMRILDINRIDEMKHEHDLNGNMLDSMDANCNLHGHYKDFNQNEISWDQDVQDLMAFLGLKHPSELSITEIDEKNIGIYLNDRKFKQLSDRDQRLVKYGVNNAKLIENKFTKPLVDATLSFMIKMMRRHPVN